MTNKLLQKTTDIKSDNKMIEEVSQIICMALKDEVNAGLSLNELETGLSPILNAIRANITTASLESYDPEKLSCQYCEEQMKNKEKLNRKIIGLVPYEISRRSFYCEACHRYEQPLDKIINIQGHFSLEIIKAITLLGQRLAFVESSDYLKKLMQVDVSHKTIQTYVESIGKAIAQDDKKEVRKLVDSQGHIKKWATSFEKSTKGIAYMQLDGAMVQTREDGWKEVRNGVLFRDTDNIRLDKHHKKLFKKQYFSVFNARKDSLQAFKNRTSQEAYTFGFHKYEHPIIIGDGAKWIWDYADMHHPYATQILDYYHACEYLGDACQSLTINDVKEKSKLKIQLFDWLSKGKISSIIRILNKQYSTEKIEKCIGYFEKNISRMDYGAYKEKGFDIGSGAIESAHRIIVQSRMKQAGMHWKKKNVQSILSLRTKYLSGNWDSVVQDYLLAA